MKLIKLIIALLICSTSFGQITNITGNEQKIRTTRVTTVGDSVLVTIGSETYIYKMAVTDLPSGGGGMTNPMTTTGDLIYSSSGSTPARLGIGTEGHVLKVVSGVTVSTYKDFAGSDATTIAANSAIEFQSNGTSWYRVL